MCKIKRRLRYCRWCVKNSSVFLQVLEQSQVKLREAGYVPGMDFPEDENVRDGEWDRLSLSCTSFHISFYIFLASLFFKVIIPWTQKKIKYIVEILYLNLALQGYINSNIMIIEVPYSLISYFVPQHCPRPLWTQPLWVRFCCTCQTRCTSCCIGTSHGNSSLAGVSSLPLIPSSSTRKPTASSTWYGTFRTCYRLENALFSSIYSKFKKKTLVLDFLYGLYLISFHFRFELKDGCFLWSYSILEYYTSWWH